MLILQLIFLTPVFFLVYVLIRAYKPVDPKHLAAFHDRERLVSTPATMRLVAAYLQRARRYRATAATLTSFLGVIAYAYVTDRITFGTGLLLFCFSGYFIGAICAETYNLRPRFRGAAEVSLEPRTVTRYSRSSSNLRLFVVSGVTTAIALVNTLIGDNIGFAWMFVGLCFLTVIAVEICQRAVASRGRPALDDDLQAADDAIRSVTIESLRISGLALVVTFLTWEVGIFGSTFDGLLPLFWLLWLAGLIWSVTLFVNARRLVWPQVSKVHA